MALSECSSDHPGELAGTVVRFAAYWTGLTLLSERPFAPLASWHSALQFWLFSALAITLLASLATLLGRYARSPVTLHHANNDSAYSPVIGITVLRTGMVALEIISSLALLRVAHTFI